MRTLAVVAGLGVFAISLVAKSIPMGKETSPGKPTSASENFRNWHFDGSEIFYGRGNVSIRNGGSLIVTGFSDLQNGLTVAGTASIPGLDTQELAFVDIELLGTTTVEILEIRGGADIAEPFEIKGLDAVGPGMVVAIDPDRTGKLRIADRPYDPTVAGIISGAKGINPGMTLSQTGTIADGDHLVALTGRVWGLADADAAGSIRAGDLLTTSETPGHAMKASDPSRRTGAVLGKAMSSLESGRGLVLVLVSLQ